MIRQFLRGCWRFVRGSTGADWLWPLGMLNRYARFAGDWRRFIASGGSASFHDIAPKLFDQGPNTQSGGGHYFYQDVWALRRLARFNPSEHHDIGSRLDGFVAQATAVCPIVYWDIRRPRFQIPNFSYREGNILQLPLRDRSILSLSCLHVVEHIGLGRYGDALDPDGADKALSELMRILQPGGQLLFAAPVGKERVEFNAHRIFDPLKPIRMFGDLKLQEFSIVTDDDRFLENANPADFGTQTFACGLYLFTR